MNKENLSVFLIVINLSINKTRILTWKKNYQSLYITFVYDYFVLKNITNILKKVV